MLNYDLIENVPFCDITTNVLCYAMCGCWVARWERTDNRAGHGGWALGFHYEKRFSGMRTSRTVGSIPRAYKMTITEDALSLHPKNCILHMYSTIWIVNIIDIDYIGVEIYHCEAWKASMSLIRGLHRSERARTRNSYVWLTAFNLIGCMIMWSGPQLRGSVVGCRYQEF